MPVLTEDQMKYFDPEDLEVIKDTIRTLEKEHGRNKIDEGTEIRTVKNNADGSSEMTVTHTGGNVKLGHMKMLCGNVEILYGVDFLTALVIKRDKDHVLTVYTDLHSPVKIDKARGCQMNISHKPLFLYRWNGSMYAHKGIGSGSKVEFQNTEIGIDLTRLPVVSELNIVETKLLFSES